MPEYPEPKTQGGTNLFPERVENSIQLQTFLGNKPRNPSRNQERMLEQSATRIGDKPRNPSQNREIMMEQDAKRIGDKPRNLGTRT